MCNFSYWVLCRGRRLSAFPLIYRLGTSVLSSETLFCLRNPGWGPFSSRAAVASVLKRRRPYPRNFFVRASVQRCFQRFGVVFYLFCAEGRQSAVYRRFCACLLPQRTPVCSVGGCIYTCLVHAYMHIYADSRLHFPEPGRKSSCGPALESGGGVEQKKGVAKSGRRRAKRLRRV